MSKGKADTADADLPAQGQPLDAHRGRGETRVWMHGGQRSGDPPTSETAPAAPNERAAAPAPDQETGGQTPSSPFGRAMSAVRDALGAAETWRPAGQIRRDDRHNNDAEMPTTQKMAARLASFRSAAALHAEGSVTATREERAGVAVDSARVAPEVHPAAASPPAPALASDPMTQPANPAPAPSPAPQNDDRSIPASASATDTPAPDSLNETAPGSPQATAFKNDPATQPATGAPPASDAEPAQHAPHQHPTGDEPQMNSPKTQIVRGPQRPTRTDFHQEPVVGWLVVIGGPGLGAFRPLFTGNNSIGRNPNQRVPVDFGDDSISGEEQAFVRYDAGDREFLFVPNLAKTNVVAVNEAKPTTAVKLSPMDVITMGQTQLVFVPFCGDDFDWSELADL
ncbi:MAG: hypothetical protein AAGF32_05815 [Pseudomonadota bacterium]